MNGNFMRETPAMHSLRMGVEMPGYANHFANMRLDEQGIDPVLAFVNTEIARQHRAAAIEATQKGPTEIMVLCSSLAALRRSET